MRIIVAQLGARMHYAVPRIFHEAGVLERLYTDSYIGNKPRLEQSLKAIIPERVRPRAVERFLGRNETRIPPEKVTSFDLFGFLYLAALKRPFDSAAGAKVLADYGRQFCTKVVASRPPEADVVWGFDGAALELFQWAKARGLRCILEQTIAPRRVLRRLLEKEIERWPGWQPNLKLSSEPDPLAEREEAEWELADRIIVGSQFVADGIAEHGGPVGKCTVVPYGVDNARFPSGMLRIPRRGGKLHVLFAGEVGLRKGAPYLLEALARLPREEVAARFAGTVVLAREKLKAYEDIAAFLGPVPRAQMPGTYGWADALVLPSVCEGSATVIYEALAAGLYVITTPNAGSILTGASAFGRIVPIQSVQAITDAIRERLTTGPNAADEATRQAADVLPIGLEDYRRRLLRALI